MFRKIVVLFISFSFIFLCGCQNNTNKKSTERTIASELSETDNSHMSSIDESELSEIENSYTSSIDENQVVDMFIRYGEYSDGTYRFIKREKRNSMSIVYSFSYTPSSNLYNCGVLVTESVLPPYELQDSGAVVFSFGQIEDGYFRGYHRLNETAEIARIEFEYSVYTFNSDISLGKYSYQVINNTFQNLYQKSDIDSYAENVFECIDWGIWYAQSILNTYCRNVTLW